MHVLLIATIYSVVLAALTLGTFACVWVFGALTHEPGGMPDAAPARPWIEGGLVPALVIAAMVITALLIHQIEQ